MCCDLFFVCVVLVKLGVAGSLTTSNRNQLVLVVATEGICHRIEEHVMEARRENVASSAQASLPQPVSLFALCFFFFFFPVCSQAFTACLQGEMSLSLREQHSSLPLKMCCACLESFSTDG